MLRPGHAGDDGARRLRNGVVDRRPERIARGAGERVTARATAQVHRRARPVRLTARPDTVPERVRNSAAVWLALMAYWALADVLLARSPPGPEGRQVAPEGWPALAVYGALGLVGVWCAARTGFPAAWDARLPAARRLLVPALAGAGFGLLAIAIEEATHSLRILEGLLDADRQRTEARPRQRREQQPAGGREPGVPGGREAGARGAPDPDQPERGVDRERGPALRGDRAPPGPGGERASRTSARPQKVRAWPRPRSTTPATSHRTAGTGKSRKSRSHVMAPAL